MSEITDDEKLARRRALAKARLDETLGRSGLIHELVAKGVKIDDGGANICAGKMAATQAEGEAEIAALRVRVTDLDVALQKSQEEVADLKNIELYAQSAIRETEAERDALRAQAKELILEIGVRDGMINDLQARVAQLERALEEIAERRFLAETMIEIARAALSQTPDAEKLVAQRHISEMDLDG